MYDLYKQGSNLLYAIAEFIALYYNVLHKSAFHSSQQ
ncbi:hypothetical protein MCW_01285 [Cardidatus Bartonella washoeensis 085-0475]|uniref:Uncharacterized protein n=1 Tax=Cardidatus Bartonella washoeensis 085-0475 TaxID=1094564 RepID=J0QEB8_9HYPH|nr:hypothetical protein MCW_01285 [Bartonella washoeensis 085-0475]